MAGAASVDCKFMALPLTLTLLKNNHFRYITITRRDASAGRERELRENCTVVVDVGKTLAKVSLWSADGRMLDRQVRPNAPCELDGIARLDARGIAAWLPGV